MTGIILYLKVKAILISALRVAYFFVKEKILCIKPRQPEVVFIITDPIYEHFVTVKKTELQAQKFCEGMEEHYTYKKHEL
jgi:hypothetical protein